METISGRLEIKAFTKIAAAISHRPCYRIGDIYRITATLAAGFDCASLLRLISSLFAIILISLCFSIFFLTHLLARVLALSKGRVIVVHCATHNHLCFDVSYSLSTSCCVVRKWEIKRSPKCPIICVVKQQQWRTNSPFSMGKALSLSLPSLNFQNCVHSMFSLILC